MRRYLRLIHSLDPATGGPPEGVRQVVPELRRRGWEGECWCADSPEASWLAGFPEPVRTWKGFPAGYAWDPLLPSRIAEEARRTGAEVLVVHGLWKWHGEAARRAARETGIPYVVFPHGMLDPWFARAQPAKHQKKRVYWMLRESRVLEEAAAVVFTCAEEERLAAQTFRPYRVRGKVVRYGIGATEPSRLPALRDAFAASNPDLAGKRCLLYLGRVHAKKGVDLLLAAWAAMATSDPAGAATRRLVVAGPGGPEALGECAAGAGVDEQQALAATVFAPGLVRGEAKAALLAGCEAFILPSHQENFGIATAEALGHGLPVYLTRQVNTWREVVEAGAGWADSDDDAGIRRLVERWWREDPDTIRATSARARSCWESRFSLEAYAESFSILLDGIARGGAKREGA